MVGRLQTWRFLVLSDGPVLRDSQEFVGPVGPLFLYELAGLCFDLNLYWKNFVLKEQPKKLESCMNPRHAMFYMRAEEFWLPENQQFETKGTCIKTPVTVGGNKHLSSAH